MDYVWPIFLTLGLIVAPVIALRLVFKRSKWRSLSSHATAYAIGATSVMWVGLLAMSLHFLSTKPLVSRKGIQTSTASIPQQQLWKMKYVIYKRENLPLMYPQP